MKSSCLTLIAALACLLSACSNFGSGKVINRILVVDERGAVVPDAYLFFEEEAKPNNRAPDERNEDYAPKSGPDGVISVNLDDYLWTSDDCYHFRIHKRGYEDTTTTVSRELMPPLMKIELRSRAYYLLGQKP